MKKRYGRFTARYLSGTVLGTIIFPVCAIMVIVVGIKKDDISVVIPEIVTFLVLGILCFLGAVLLTKRINKRTPPDERKETWFRALKLGFKININGALKIIGFIFHCSIGFDTSIPEEDTVATSRGEWYEKRKYVYDENGNQYEVGRSGGYIQDKSGNWIKVERDDVGEPYIGSGSEKTWLK